MITLSARLVCKCFYSVSERVIRRLFQSSTCEYPCSLWNVHTWTLWELLVTYSAIFLYPFCTSRHRRKKKKGGIYWKETQSIQNSGTVMIKFILIFLSFFSLYFPEANCHQNICFSSKFFFIFIIFSSNIASSPYFFLNWTRWFKGLGITGTD